MYLRQFIVFIELGSVLILFHKILQLYLYGVGVFLIFLVE